MKLTKSRVEELPVLGEATFHWDDELKGFGVKVLPSGKRMYVVQGRVNGQSRRVTLGAHGVLTCDEARKKAKLELVKLIEGKDPQEEKKRAKANSVTLREVVTDYCENRRTRNGGPLTKSTVKVINRHLETNLIDWADKPIFNITSSMCRTHFEKMSKTGPTQANQCYRILHSLINYAIDEENPQPNPVDILSRKKLWNPNRRKTGYIPMNKVGFVWNKLNELRHATILPIEQTQVDAVKFIMLTGCRWSEAAELTWDYVKTDSWHDPDPKNHNAITFPLSAPARVLMESRVRIQDNNYVFPGRHKKEHPTFITSVRQIMTAISEVAGLRLSPHDLRRTFIQIGIKLKIELWKLKLLTNHIAKGDVTLDHYTETSDLRYLAPEIEQIGAWIEEQGRIAAAENVIPFKKA